MCVHFINEWLCWWIWIHGTYVNMKAHNNKNVCERNAQQTIRYILFFQRVQILVHRAVCIRIHNSKEYGYALCSMHIPIYKFMWSRHNYLPFYMIVCNIKLHTQTHTHSQNILKHIRAQQQPKKKKTKKETVKQRRNLNTHSHWNLLGAELSLFNIMFLYQLK